MVGDLSNRCVVLAAGGTGGHTFPAEAVAAELRRRGVGRVALITDARTAEYGHQFEGVETHTIRAGTLGRGLLGKIKGVLNIGLGVVQARRLLKRLKPDCVIGFGGYPSFPTMLAATQQRIPTIIHEQNAVLGRANRLLAGRVTHIASSFRGTQAIPARAEVRTVHTGNPVRHAVAVLRQVPYPELTNESMLRILVTGGSQGASVFSQIVPAALAILPASLRARIRVDQQCRKEDIDVARVAYREIGVSADLATFFQDIPARLAAAHLVICRAGASTVCELLAAGRPAILVPYPHAMDNHQAVNAELTEQAGACWVMPQEGFTAQALAVRLESILSLPGVLKQTADKALAAGIPDAASRVVDILEQSFTVNHTGLKA